MIQSRKESSLQWWLDMTNQYLVYYIPLQKGRWALSIIGMRKWIISDWYYLDMQQRKRQMTTDYVHA